MTVLVLGPSGSGKSVFAERLAAYLTIDRLYYIATMQPFGAEGLARVEKHRRQREAYGFVTLERPFDVSSAPLPPGSTVLLEDVSNLLANAVFERGASWQDVFADIAALCESCASAVLVSIGGVEDAPEYDEGTRTYIDGLNRLNEELAGYADAVAEMRGGVPVFLKGESLCAGFTR